MKLDHHDKFTGIAHLMATIKERENVYTCPDASSNIYNGDPDWSKQTLAEATKIADDGGADFDTADKMVAVKELTDASMLDAIYLPNWTPSVAGFLPNVAAYCAGEPLSMYDQSEAVLETAKVIKIAITCIPSAGVNADSMLNRGAALLGAIDALERDGNTRVELVGLFPSFSDRAKNCLMEIAIKAAGDDWNPASVAFTLANPAFGRRIGFKWLESKEEYADNVNANYGSGKLMAAAEHPIECDVYIPYLTTDDGYRTPDDAVKSVSAIINTQLNQLEQAA